MNNTAILIVAAGSSSRLGSPKQLLAFRNKTLLQHTIDEALASDAEPIVIVLGANANEISREIQLKQIVYNEDWKQGMASGIVAGVREIIAIKKDVERIIIAVCDQPFVSAVLFRQLYQAQQESGKHIAASSYAGTLGTPVLFTRNYFDALLTLQGDEGAKKIVKANHADVAAVDFPQGNTDIDTPADYHDLVNS